MVLRITYAILGVLVGLTFMTTEQKRLANTEEMVYTRNIAAFNAAKLACIKATNANWNKCWVISNEIFEILHNE